MLLLQKQAQKKDEPSSDFPYLCSQESLEPLSVLLFLLHGGMLLQHLISWIGGSSHLVLNISGPTEPMFAVSAMAHSQSKSYLKKRKNSFWQQNGFTSSSRIFHPYSPLKAFHKPHVASDPFGHKGHVIKQVFPAHQIKSADIDWCGTLQKNR